MPVRVPREMWLVLFFLIPLQLAPQRAFSQDLHAKFLDPPPEARPIMRWWWFGPAVTEHELGKELGTMHDAGIGGVEIQPVYPIALDNPANGIHNFPYLSQQFLQDVSFANSAARSLGLRVDITLGSGWPYGGAGTPLSLAAGKLRVVSLPIHGAKVELPRLDEGERFIAAFALEGTERAFSPSSAVRIDLKTGTVAASDAPRIALYFIASHTRQQVKRAAMGAEGYVLDHFSKAAIDQHLSDVGLPLLQAFGSQPPYSVFSDSLEVYGSDWTTNLPLEFQRRRGYDLVPHLPELVAGGSAEADEVRHDWGVTLSDLIREHYLAPITAFAQAHHTLFRSQTYGEPAVTMADEAIANLPEGEGPQWRAFSFTRWASSANHLYGRNVTSAETWTWLHSPAFRATPLDMKVEADRMFLLGVNQIVGHGYPYSPLAAGEPGWAFYAAGAFNVHNPWFPVMPDVMRYLQRISWLLRQGNPANDVAILLPEDDAQAAFTPGHVSVTDEMKTRITPELMAAILDAGYNVDFIDAETIRRLGRISYPVLILPPTDRIPLDVYGQIATYSEKGGKVIAIGKTPSIDPGLLNQRHNSQVIEQSHKLFDRDVSQSGIFVHSVNDLAPQIRRVLPPDLICHGQAIGLGFIHRKLASSDVYFVANTHNREVKGNIAFRSVRAVIEQWNPDTGQVMQSISYNPQKGVDISLAPYESRIFVLKNGPTTSKAEINDIDQGGGSEKARQIEDLSTEWKIQMKGQAQKQTLNGLPSWTELHGLKYFSGRVDYFRSFILRRPLSKQSRIVVDFGQGTPTVDDRPPNANGIHALLDPPIREAATIYVNGRLVGSLWHPPYRIDITGFVHAGANQLRILVYNTAINELAGEPPHDYSALYAKFGTRFIPQDMNNLDPVPSGLLGPIRLVEVSAALAVQ